MIEAIIAILIGGGCIDGAPCYQTNHDGTIIVPNEGGIVVEGDEPPRRAPGMKANPTWICPDGTSNPPNLC